MKELCIKYPSLVIPKMYIDLFTKVKRLDAEKTLDENDKSFIYTYFKANISCIGMTPEEYETCIKWFCEVMEY